MKLADKIIYKLIMSVRKGGNEVVIPNFYVGRWEMDLFRLLPSGFLSEYEIKISRADFRNDFKKQISDRKFNRETFSVEETNVRTKHDIISAGDYPANKFYFVVPEGLVKPEEVPEKYGLIYYVEEWDTFREIRPARFIHKEKRAPDLEQICKALSYRELRLRLKLSRLTETNKLLKNARC